MASTDGSVNIAIEMNVDDAERELAALKKQIISLEKDTGLKKFLHESLVEQVNQAGANLDEAKAKLIEMQNADWGTYSKQEISEQEERVKLLKKEYEKLASEEEKISAEIERGNLQLEYTKQRYGEVAVEADRLRAAQQDVVATEEDSTAAENESVIAEEQATEQAKQMAEATSDAKEQVEEMSNATQRSEGFMSKLSHRIAGLAKRVFVFSMVTSALRSVRSLLEKVIKTNDEANAAFSRLKGALLTLAQPIIELLIPALTALANILTVIVSSIASLLSGLFGKTAEQSANAAKGLYEETEALEGIGGAAEEAAGSLASFDEINTIQTETSGGGGGGGAAALTPDFTLDSEISDRLKKIANLVTLIGAGLALWKISKKLPGTLGKIAKILAGILITIGGLLLAWDGLSDAWNNGVNWGNLIESIAGVAAAAFGLYLIFGKMGAGIGLVVGGIAMLVTAFHDAKENGWNLQNTLLAIAGLLAGGLGISLMTGSWIPLLIAGIAAALLAITNFTGHGEELIKGLEEIFKGFKDFFKGVFTGDMELAAEGLKEIFNGLKTFVSAIWESLRDIILRFLDWLDEKTNGKFHDTIETIKTTVRGVFDSVEKIFSGFIDFVSGIFTGDFDRVISGITDIVDGLFEEVDSKINGLEELFDNFLEWLDEKTGGKFSGIIEFVRGLVHGLFEFISQTLGDIAESLKTILSGVIEFISGVFTGDWSKAWDGIKDIFKGVWNGIVGLLEDAVNLVIRGINWLISKINTISFKVPDWVPGVGGKSIGFSIPSIREITIPRLAQGAVIPPNREFMAVLGDQKSGTNIEAPEDTIRKIVREETGGGVEILQEILQAIKAGQVIQVDGTTFGRTAIRSINNVTHAAGKQLLSI